MPGISQVDTRHYGDIGLQLQIGSFGNIVYCISFSLDLKVCLDKDIVIQGVAVSVLVADAEAITGALVHVLDRIRQRIRSRNINEVLLAVFCFFFDRPLEGQIAFISCGYGRFQIDRPSGCNVIMI